MYFRHKFLGDNEKTGVRLHQQRATHVMAHSEMGGDGQKHQIHVVCPATVGIRAKKDVACVRGEMKAWSHDKSDKKSSEFSHGAGGARWMEAADSTSGTLAISGTPVPREPVARWVPAQMQMSNHQRETIGQGAMWWARGEADRRREGARERVPSPPLFIATIDRGVCALIQVDHLLELDKRARAWALCCHSWSVR